MPTDHEFDWSTNLLDSLWFHIGKYLTMNDIHRLCRTCSRFHQLFSSHDFWSYLLRRQFGSIIWYRLTRNPSLVLDQTIEEKSCRAKFIYFQLIKRKRISFSHFPSLSLDTNRNYITIADPSSLTGYVLCIKDSIELSYSLHIETMFRDILPGKYDVIWRMKLDIPYILGETEFYAVADQIHLGEIAYMRWTQDDFLSMYRCFNCDITKTNLWFYQTIGIVEVTGNKPCNVHVSMTNQDSTRAKLGLFLDYVELKLHYE